MVKCPACGTSVSVPEKKTGLWWGIGCLIAALAIPFIVAVIGLLAAIAIPAFVKARDTSQRHACVKVPLEIIHANDLHLKISVGGRDLLLLVDTGASGTAVDARMLSRLDLPPACNTSSEVRRVSGSREEKHFHNVSVSVGGRSFVFETFGSADFSSVMPAVNDPLASAVGVLGADFLLSTGAVIDFKNRELRIPFPLVSRITQRGEPDGPANGGQPFAQRPIERH